MSAVKGSWRVVRWCESTNWRTTPQVYVLKLSDEIYDLKIGGQVFWKSYKRSNLKTTCGIFEHRGVCSRLRGLADSTFNKLWKKELSVSHSCVQVLLYRLYLLCVLLNLIKRSVTKKKKAQISIMWSTTDRSTWMAVQSLLLTVPHRLHLSLAANLRGQTRANLWLEPARIRFSLWEWTFIL